MKQKSKWNLNYATVTVIILWCCSCATEENNTEIPLLKVSENGRFLETEGNDPFFWLGDTGWLLFTKTSREEAERYLDNRKEKGFNVIQVMVVQDVDAVNVYGDSALINKNVATPRVTGGSDIKDSLQYDFWDHVDFIVDESAEKGLYMALVPVWGSNVKDSLVTEAEATRYAEFLASRYKNKKNIVWLNGGDMFGNIGTGVWNTIGNTLKANDPTHLVTFHPRGRTQSSAWFHDKPWLDFNMFQSGHRRYDQDTASASLRYGEDNWRYVNADYNKQPVKPTLDGEPSYEGIPQGLHDPAEPFWKDDDVRRYAYWSVFAGACGFTYGHNSVMQMLKPTDAGGAYGATEFWFDAMNAPGASQMVHLKELMLSRPYFDRVPDQSLIASQHDRYAYQVATRGETYAFLYTYNGDNLNVTMGKIKENEVKASWYDPRTGKTIEIGTFENRGTRVFDPPGEAMNGNDWVLILDSLQ
jgi:hypothetical protein